jgi:16S rRNA (guanine527-N7)-methyltransferase
MRDVDTLIREHAASFQRYYEMLVDWNERVNLTAITDKAEVFVKHFTDSLYVVTTEEWRRIEEAGGTVLDVGTGAGFPGLPLAICHPHLSFVLCDSLQKRVQFVKSVCDELGIDNVEVVHGRAEDLARNTAYRQRFDAVVSRAVARLNVLVELTLPFVCPGGFFFSYKGPGVEEELPDGVRAAGVLSGTLERLYNYHLPNDMGERVTVVFRQAGQVPKAYPRKAGTPQKHPL